MVSRCQRLELLPVAASAIQSYLEETWGVEPKKAILLARLSKGSPGWAINAITDEAMLLHRNELLDKLEDIIFSATDERFAHAARLAAQFSQSREDVYGVLDLWLDYWRDILLVSSGCSDIISSVDRLARLVEIARDYSLKQIRSALNSIQSAKEQLALNVNAQLALDVMMLDIPGKEKGGTIKRLATR